jgi:hypothetical protein
VVGVEDGGAADLAQRFQVARVHAMVSWRRGRGAVDGGAGVDTVGKFVDL